MKWSSDKPTTAGWYWYRTTKAQGKVLVHVRGTGKWTTAILPKGRWQSIFLLPGEWAGLVKKWRTANHSH